MTARTFLDRLVDHAPSVLAEYFGPNSTACIIATRAARTALAHVGVFSQPAPVALDARSASRWVHIGPESEGNDWSGHLVLVGDGWLLDLTADQVNRQGLTALPHWMPATPPCTVQQDGAHLTYTPIDDDGYRQSPNWASSDLEQVQLRAALIGHFLDILNTA